MENTQRYIKELPDGAPSALSLNYYVVHSTAAGGPRTAVEKKGMDLCSLQMLRRGTAEVFADYDGEKDRDVIGFLNRKRLGSAGEREAADRVAEMAAEGLAELFSSLRIGAPESRRKNRLTEADWAFWRDCSHVFLVGKLAEGELGIRLETHLMECLMRHGVSGMQVRCVSFPQVGTPSLLGCARACGGAACVYVFDLGNTAFKRGRAVLGPDGYVVDEQPAVVHRDYGGLADTRATGEAIHREILDVILSTIESYGGDGDSYTVSLCIANNILKKKLMDRGHYQSLRFLSPFYADYLQRDLAGKTGKRVTLKLWNDAGAVATLFSDWAPRAAVVTLGTYMGIAYPRAILSAVPANT